MEMRKLGTRKLGTSDLEIVPLIFGGNVFGWTADEPTSFALLDAFVAAGGNCVDTANVYSVWVPGHTGGESETILGKWFAQGGGRREKIVLLSKVGFKMGDGGQGLGKEYIKRSAEASLKRLQTDVIDLYQSHTDDAETPLEETLEAYAELIAEGKVRAIGASNYKGARLTEALEVAKSKGLPAYATLQPNYSLADREGFETDLLPAVEQDGVGVIPYYSLASGFLTGKYKSVEDTAGKARGSRVEKYFNERGERILTALRQVSEETGAEQASVALAWLLAQPTVTAPIASATRTEQLPALLAAVELKLSEAQVKTLTDASAY